ncbi:hypothetical protein M0R45_029983 [Rubus argutus]|uniref:Uncharacterized protein n=1 Tax=Rubus argutus TaxID=59490 RepID=A0AAW1W9L9_RUBAR
MWWARQWLRAASGLRAGLQRSSTARAGDDGRGRSNAGCCEGLAAELPGRDRWVDARSWARVTGGEMRSKWRRRLGSPVRWMPGLLGSWIEYGRGKRAWALRSMMGYQWRGFTVKTDDGSDLKTSTGLSVTQVWVRGDSSDDWFELMIECLGNVMKWSELETGFESVMEAEARHGFFGDGDLICGLAGAMAA